MYTTLYQKVLAEVKQIQPQSQTPWSDSILRTKSQTNFGPKKWINQELRKSKSSSRSCGTSSEYNSRKDPRTLIIPAIMKAEKARLDRKLLECESSSSNLSMSLPKPFRYKKVKTRKNRGVTLTKQRKAVVYKDGSDQEGHDLTCESSPQPRPSESESSCSLNLRIDLHSSKSSYNPSSLRTSEIPASPAEESRVDSLVRRRKADFKDEYLLAIAEKFVHNILEVVVRLEIEQERERMEIEDPEERAAAEVRHRRNNEEYVRTKLMQERMKLGTMEAARLAQLWEMMKGEKKVFRKGVPFGQWLREKHAKLRAKRVRDEAARLEKEEKQKMRQEKAREAYDQWKKEVRKKPHLPQFVIYSTDEGTYQYVRAGAFFNPNPWVDILEEERQRQKLVEMADRSCQAPLLWRQCRPIRSVSTRVRSDIPSTGAGNYPMRVTSLAAQRGVVKQSTYDNIVDFYTDLLHRCQSRKHRPATTPKRDSYTLALADGKLAVMTARSKSATNSKVLTPSCKSVSDNTTFVKSRGHWSQMYVQ